jgi:hypothetical protein
MMAGICLKRSCKGHLCLRLHLNLHFCSAAPNSHFSSAYYWTKRKKGKKEEVEANF